MITQVRDEDSAPESISMTFDDGLQVTVELDKFTGGVAHYTIEDIEDFDVQTVASATASIYAGWSGQFNLSHGPCAEGDGAPDQEDPVEDEPAQDQPAQDQPAQDQPAQDQPAQDQPAQDEPVQDQPAQDGPVEDGAAPAGTPPAPWRRWGSPS